MGDSPQAAAKTIAMAMKRTVEAIGAVYTRSSVIAVVSRDCPANALPLSRERHRTTSNQPRPPRLPERWGQQ